MKKALLSSFLFLFIINVAYGQNAFYDAQTLASITQEQQNKLKSGFIDPRKDKFSEEELMAIDQLNNFLNPKSAIFSNTSLDRQLLNHRLIAQILAKIKYIIDQEEKSKLGLPGTAEWKSGTSTASSFLGLFSGNSISKLGSADFQTMLIDATSTYIAKSFKEDMTYMFFTKFKRKLDSIPGVRYLLPESYKIIAKIDPFNFKDLGSSWKVAFEKDIQNVPVNFQSFVNLNQNIPWCQKIYSSKFYNYYNYSVDIIDPLIKGYHPVEILDILDAKYNPPSSSVRKYNGYKSLVHFINLLQSNLQDSTKHSSDKQYENLWISFNQLKELNTAKKRLYFCALIYLQDRSFFDNDSLGHEIKNILMDGANQQNFINSLNNLLILFNQVEEEVKDIKAAKAEKKETKELVKVYMKNVLSIMDSSSTFLKKISPQTTMLDSLTKGVDSCLKYSNKAYRLYEAIVIKNYPGVIDQTIDLLSSFDQNSSAMSSMVWGAISGQTSELTTLNSICAGIYGAGIPVKKVQYFLLQSIHFNMISSDEFNVSVKQFINYDKINDPVIKRQVDASLTSAAQIIAVLNKKLSAVVQSNGFTFYLKTISTLNRYGKVIASIATAENSEDLEIIIKNYIATPSSYAIQRTSLSTISIATHVGLSLGAEGSDKWEKFKPNVGLTVPLGFEFTWGRTSSSKTNIPYLTDDNKVKYLTGSSRGIFLQVFDLAAVVNYRLGGDSSSSLPQKILLKQVFSPGLTYNFGIKNSPFAVSFGGQYTPQLRKIGSDLQANSIRLFVRISWDKPLLFLYSRRETKTGFKIDSN